VNIKISFPGANPNARIEPFNRLDTVVSYFIGNDPAKWHVAVPVWGGVRYVDLYPGVDLELTGENGQVVPRLVASRCRPERGALAGGRGGGSGPGPGRGSPPAHRPGRVHPASVPGGRGECGACPGAAGGQPGL
jgi:hypothetical protein